MLRSSLNIIEHVVDDYADDDADDDADADDEVKSKKEDEAIIWKNIIFLLQRISTKHLNLGYLLFSLFTLVKTIYKLVKRLHLYDTVLCEHYFQYFVSI